MDTAIEVGKTGSAEISLQEKAKRFLDSVQSPVLNQAEVEGQLKDLGNETTLDLWESALNNLESRAQVLIINNLRHLANATTATTVRTELENVRTLIEMARKGKETPQPPVANDEKAAPPPEEKKTFVEQSTKVFESIRKDFNEGSIPKKFAYIGSGFVGFVVAQWGWHKLFGDGTNQGLVMRGIRWLASIIGVGLGAIGAKSVMDWWNKKTDSPLEGVIGYLTSLLPDWLKPKNEKGPYENGSPPGPKKDEPSLLSFEGAANAARDTAQGAGKQLLDIGSKAIDITQKDAKFWVDLFSTNNMDEAMQLISDQGWTLTCENGTFFLHDLGWNTVALPMLSTSQMVEWMGTGKKPKDFWAVFGASGIAYFVGKNALQGHFMRFLPHTTKDVVWTLLKIGTGPGDFLLDVARVADIALQEGGVQALRLRYFKYNILGSARRSLQRRVWSGFFQNEKSVLKAIDQCAEYSKDLKVLEIYGPTKNKFGYLFDEDLTKEVRSLMETIAKRIQKFTKTMKVESSSSKLLVKLKEIADITDTTEYIKKFEEIRSAHLNEVVVPSGAAGSAAETPTVKPGATESTSAKTTDDLDTRKPAVDDPNALKPKPTDAAVETASSTKALEAADIETEIAKLAKGNASTEDALRKCIQGASSHDEAIATLRRIQQYLPEGTQLASDAATAQKQVVALAKAGPTEIAQLGKFAKTVTALGIAADILVIWTAWMDYRESSAKIQQTTNAELKDLRSGRYKYIAADVTIGVVGATSGVMLLAGVGTAVAAPVAIVALPAALTVGAFRSMHSWKETISMDATDIAKEHEPAEIIAMLQYKPAGEAVGQYLPRAGRILTENIGGPEWKGYGKATRSEIVDQKHLNLMRMTALALATTTVSMPEKMRDDEERQFYGGALQAYLDAKIQYLEKQAKGITAQPFEKTDMAVLLADADAYGRLQHDRYVTEVMNGQDTNRFLGQSLSQEEQAKEYRRTLRKDDVRALLLASRFGRLDDEQMLQNACRNLLDREIGPSLLAFRANILREDTDFKNLLFDGDAGKIVETHVLSLVEQRMSQTLIGLSGQVRQWREQPGYESVPAVVDRLEKDSTEITKLLARSPIDWWNEVPEPTKNAARKRIHAAETVAELTPKISAETAKFAPATHRDFDKPEAIEQRMKLADMRLVKYQNQKKLSPTAEAPDLTVEKMTRGAAAVRGILGKTNHNDWFWEQDKEIPAFRIAVKNKYLHSMPVEWIFFNPDTKKWEWKNGARADLFKRVSGQVAIGNQASTTVDYPKTKSGHSFEWNERIKLVLQRLDEINREAAETSDTKPTVPPDATKPDNSATSPEPQLAA